jgi:hypothetical protein
MTTLYIACELNGNISTQRNAIAFTLAIKNVYSAACLRSVVGPMRSAYSFDNWLGIFTATPYHLFTADLLNAGSRCRDTLYLALSMKVHCGQSCIPAGVSDIHGCNHPGVWRLGQTLWARRYECFAVVVSSHISRAVLLHRVIQRASFLCSALSQPLCATAVCRFGC